MKKERVNKTFEGSFPVEIAADEFFSRLTAEDVAIPAANFDEFIQKVFSLSYPGYDFNTWHVRLLCAKAEEAFNSVDNPYLLAVLPRYHLKCVRWNTSVLLNNGLRKQIKDLIVGEDVIAYDNCGHLMDAKVKSIEFCRQKAKKVILQSGKEIIASDNHRFYCNLGWKPLSDIKVGDLMAEPMKVKVATNNKLSESDAILLGYFYSEGTKDIRCTIGITNESEQAFRDLTLIAKEHNWKLRKDEKCHYSFSKITGKYGNQKDAPIHYLKDVLGVESKEYLTDELSKASDDIIKIFLQRFWFGDGTINAKTCQMSVTQKSKRLCEDIQMLLLRFGIVSSISSTHCKTQKGLERYYWLSISSKDSIDKFAEEIGFLKEIHIKKYKELDEKRNFEKSDYIPAVWRNCIKSKRSILLNKVGADSDYSYSTPRYKLEKACALVENEELNQIANSDVCWKRVVSIEDVGEQDLVDIQLSPEGAFIGDGIICHNSTILGYGATIYRMLKSFGEGLYISYKEDLANIHAYHIKKAVAENSELSKIMVDLSPQSDSVINYRIGKKQLKIYTSGITAVKRGLHADSIVIGDDLMGDVLNPMIMTDIENTKKLFDAEIMQIPNRGCPMFVYGTIISNEDLFFHLKDKPRFKERVIWLPALNPDEEHDVLWEARFPRKWLEMQKDDIGWKAFSTEFLLVPVLSTQAFFTKEQLDTIIDKSAQNYLVPGF